MKKILFTILILPLVLFNFAEAQVGDKLFGGQSSMVQYCTCDMTIMVTIDNKENNSTEYFIYSPMSTELFKWSLFMMPGVYMLGKAEPMSTQCKVISGNSCMVIGTGYPMKMLGTSLPF